MTAFNTPPEDQVPDCPDGLPGFGIDDGNPVIRIADADELQRSIPHLIGFHPTRSVIAVGVHRDSGRLGPVVRINAPVTEQDAYAAGARFGEVLARGGSTLAYITYYDDGTAFGADSVAAETELCFERTRTMQYELAAGMDANGVQGRFAWPRDAVPEPSLRPSAVQVAAVALGRTTYRTRADVQDRVQPIGGIIRAEVADAATELELIGLSSWELVRLVCELLEERADIRRIGEPLPRSASSDLAVCAVAASTVHSRDVLLTLMSEDRDLMDLELWLEVTRCAPTGLVAGSATVAALCAYLQGDGVLAACALDRALTIDPRYRLATLAESALENGVPPEDIAALLRSTTIVDPE